MSFTASYIKQHNELLELVGKLTTKLNKTEIEKDAPGIISILSQFASKLNLHLSMEDKALYPKLLNSSNPNVIKTTKEFQIEMGGLKPVVEKFVQEWSLINNIKSKPDQFITETNNLIAALGKRIEKENTILYPMADA